jgi:GTPase SAR1 family protein
MTQPADILLVTGPAGIGKSTLCWEIGSQLSQAGVPHAIVETDELDRVFPKPDRETLQRHWPGTIDISAVNLAAIWSTYRTLGISRLIMSGVMMHAGFDRRWILQAIPDARILTIRLLGSESTVVERLQRREIVPDDDQLSRSLRQTRVMTEEADSGFIRISTDGRTPTDIAGAVLSEIGWLASRS